MRRMLHSMDDEVLGELMVNVHDLIILAELPKWHYDDIEEARDREGVIGGPCERSRVEHPLDLPGFSVHEIEGLAEELLKTGDDGNDRFMDHGPEPEGVDDVELWDLWRVTGEIPANSVEGCGVELLGFYHPFHRDAHHLHPWDYPWDYPGDERWGIYLFAERITGLAYAMAGRAGVPGNLMLGALIFHVIRHEWHHFAEEVMLSHLEIVLGHLFYQEWSRLYGQLWPNNTINESLANARALSETRNFLSNEGLGRTSGYRKDIVKALEEMMHLSQGAYSRFDEFVRPDDYRKGLGAWLGQATHGFYGRSQVVVAEAARMRHTNRRIVPVRVIKRG